MKHLHHTEHEANNAKAEAKRLADEEDLRAFNEWGNLMDALNTVRAQEEPSTLQRSQPRPQLGKRSRSDTEDNAYAYGDQRCHGGCVRSDKPFLISQVNYEILRFGQMLNRALWMPNCPNRYKSVMVGCFTVSVGKELNDNFDASMVLDQTYPTRCDTYLYGHSPEIMITEANSTSGKLHFLKEAELQRTVEATRCVPHVDTVKEVQEAIPVDFDMHINATRSFFQTLCIPDKMSLGLKEFHIPGMRGTFNELIRDQELTGIYGSDPSMSLKGILILQFMQENWISEFVTHFCNMSKNGANIPVLGSIIQDFGGMASKSMETTASGWIISGNDRVTVSVVGIDPSGIDGSTGRIFDEDKAEILARANLNQYFPEIGDGFILAFYDPTYAGAHECFDQIRSLLPSVPMLGVSTYADFLFKGIEIPTPPEDVEILKEPIIRPAVKIALLMINY